jgi:heme exporter protein CcmD
MSEFFAMSGYGRYLWPSYAIGFGVVALNYVLAVRALANSKLQAKRRLEMSK